jgi:UDPglucose--hexose-1-phosphate uridylyltransferase
VPRNSVAAREISRTLGCPSNLSIGATSLVILGHGLPGCAENHRARKTYIGEVVNITGLEMSEIRENRITGESVIIAPERAKRGGDLVSAGDRIQTPFLASCPFCPGNEALTAEERFRFAGETDGWILRSVVNKFSVLSPKGKVGLSHRLRPSPSSVNGVGLHEVLVESPRHDGLMAEFEVSHLQRILEAYRHRFLEFYGDSRVRHVIIFKNHGADAGASQQHPHSQIVGLPIVPGQIVERTERARRVFDATGCCLACIEISQERTHGCRIVAESDDFVTFIPYAALSPYHLWIFPKAHAACFSEQSVETLAELATTLRTVLRKLYGMLGNPPFNLVIRSLGPEEMDAGHFHWYILIVPRINKRAGFELGTGMYVNASLPESSAEALRNFSGF